MAGQHGGSRTGSGRKRNAERHEEQILGFTDLCAGHLQRVFANLRQIADGEAERYETKWAPAGTLTRKDVARNKDGDPIMDRNGRMTVVEVLLYPELPADEPVCIETKRISLPPETKANEVISERVAGRAMQAIELGNGDDGPLKIQVVYADADYPSGAAEAAPVPGEDPAGDEAV
jgi:hypothetical protein